MKRTSLWKVLRIFLAALFLMIGSYWLWFRSVESRQLQRLKERVTQIHAELDAICGARPALRGNSLPGDAWDDYFRAASLADRIPDFAPIRNFVFRKADREPVRRLLEQHGAALDALRNGTRRAEAKRVRFYEEEPLFEIRDDTRLGRLSALSTLAVCKARILAEGGRAREAVEWLLDLGQLALDIARDSSSNARLYSDIILRNILEELKELLTQGLLSADECLQIDRELTQIDSGWPQHHFAVLGTLEDEGSKLLADRLLPELTSNQPLPPEARAGWRHAFSQKLLMIDAYLEADLLAARLRATESASWTEEKGALKRFVDDRKAERSPWVSFFAMGVTNGRAVRVRRAQLRLVRAGAHFVATGNMLELPDPFGTTIHHRVEPDRLRVWSVGENGKDDGGKGDFNGKVDDLILDIPDR